MSVIVLVGLVFGVPAVTFLVAALVGAGRAVDEQIAAVLPQQFWPDDLSSDEWWVEK